ncbi:MAG: phosphatase PAP2 family protein [Chloroflexota bacterium]|nr:MAG: phosphatase PAP2 family protein [Chloroflexota bacterium]
MNTLYELGISLVLYLQNLGTWLDGPMQFFSFLGSAEFYLLVMPILYWSIDASLGFRLGIILMLSDGLNYILKIGFHTARPFWYSSRVKALAYEYTFGLPSGHAQVSAAVFGLIAASAKRYWAWLLSLLVILLIGVSRIYLAVHFPQDVIVGWMIGFITVGLFLRLEKPIGAWLSHQTLGIKILAAFLFSIYLLTLGVIVRSLVIDWPIPQSWLDNARNAFPEEEPINPLKLLSLMRTCGALFGFSAGAAWLSARGGFSARGSWKQRTIRFLLGILGVAVLWLGLGALIPEEETLLGYSLYYAWYASIGFWLSGFAPAIFVRLGLAEAQ